MRCLRPAVKTRRTAVLGAGIMGSGIAQVSAVAGYTLVVQDITGDALDKSKETIEKSLEKFAGKGKIQESDMNSALGRISFTTNMEEACKEADLIIEAIFIKLERVSTQIKIFGNINEGTPLILYTDKLYFRVVGGCL